MSAYTRKDSKYWYLFLETTKQKEKTNILVGETRAQQKDNALLAKALYHTRMAEIAKGHHHLAPTPITFNAFADVYDRTAIALHRGRDRERQILPRLRAAFGVSLLTQIDKASVLEWRALRLTTPTVIEKFGGPKGKRRVLPPPSLATVGRELNLLKSILAAAVPKYLVASPIAGKGGLGPSVKLPRRKKRIMTADEEAQFLAAFQDPADALVFMIAVDCLVRLGDVLDLRKDDDLGETLRVRDPKNGVELAPPISPRVRKALDALPANDSQFLFPKRRSGLSEEERRHSYLTLCRRTAKRAGVPWGRATGGNTFHWATRRTGAIRLLRTGTSNDIVSVVQAIGGWAGSDTAEGYNGVTQDEMHAAVQKLHGVAK
jgi:integrase